MTILLAVSLLHIVSAFLIAVLVVLVAVSLIHKGDKKDKAVPPHKTESDIESRLLSNRKAKMLARINEVEPKVDEAFSDISTYYNFGHYITESERQSLDRKYMDLSAEVRFLSKQKPLDDSPAKDIILRFKKAMSDSEGFKKSNNEHFISDQLKRHQAFFDTVLSHPLDNQQREAIVSLEDNVLVIASAGSGKTMTTVGKVRYLIDIQHVDPKKILLITFTRKAAESLSQRLGEPNLKCRTFHKLAIDMIGEALGEKPSITGSDFPLQAYHNLFEKNEAFHRAIAEYILRSRYSGKDRFSYSNLKDYIMDRKKFGVQAYYPDMDGKPVFCKSEEECRIADFLGSRGIDFRYEEPYEHNIADSEHRRYTPDFSIHFTNQSGVKRRIYLEHFAVNEFDRCPSFFTPAEEERYHQDMIWKRQVHIEHGTVMLETASADFHNGSIFRQLENMLKRHGVEFNIKEPQKLSRELVRQEENILSMLTSFIFLMKSRDMNLYAIISQVYDPNDRFVLTEIIEPFVKEYSRLKKERNEIDFTDAILQATELCNNGHRPDYDYILVDEFQDISLDRYRFLQALRRDKPLTKLFCVGDDWQSIYRFAGSDMALFKSFSDYFGYTKKCLMETTYRFGNPAIDLSSNFILANPGQEPKEVHSFKQDLETKLDFFSTEGADGMADTVKIIADTVPPDKDILLLGRYSFDINVLNGSGLSVKTDNGQKYVQYGNRRMKFMTVHQSKGLESDYVILINCNGGTLGFPSNVSDSPVLKYVLSEPDSYAYSEERRIFYVGITRGKVHTWVLYDMDNPSPFLSEFVEGVRNSMEYHEDIPEKDLCPRCRCGRKKQIRKGVAVNGNPYYVVGCQNNKYGCDYHETFFVNLNDTSRHNRYYQTHH